MQYYIVLMLPVRWQWMIQKKAEVIFALAQSLIDCMLGEIQEGNEPIVI